MKVENIIDIWNVLVVEAWKTVWRLLDQLKINEYHCHELIGRALWWLLIMHKNCHLNTFITNNAKCGQSCSQQTALVNKQYNATWKHMKQKIKHYCYESFHFHKIQIIFPGKCKETKKQSYMNSKWNNMTMKYCSIMGWNKLFLLLMLPDWTEAQLMGEPFLLFVLWNLLDLNIVPGTQAELR